MNYKATFDYLLKILKNEKAAIKLMILHYGVYINGNELEKELKGYPEQFRVKRARKKTGLRNGKLYDLEQTNQPFIPEEFFLHFSNCKSIVKVNFNPDSPFELVRKNEQIFLQSRQLELKIPASLSLKNKVFKDKEKQLAKLIPILGSDRAAILGYEGCSGWLRGKQCKFCDSCASRPDEKSPIPSLNDLNTRFKGQIKPWLESCEEQYFKKLKQAFAILAKNRPEPHCHLHIMAGNLVDVNEEWKYMLRLTNSLNQIEKIEQMDSYLNLIPPEDLSFLKNAKDSGYRNLLYSMEVFGEEAYNKVCPEKSEIAPFKHFMKTLKESVSIFGKGKVRCNFVLGAQPIKDLLPGVKLLAKMGVASDFTIFTPKKGTPWQHKKKPELLEIAQFSKFLYDLYCSYNFQGIYCSESSRSCILNELSL